MTSTGNEKANLQETSRQRYLEVSDREPSTLQQHRPCGCGTTLDGLDDFAAALELARGHGRVIAARHLRGGHDVIFPQLVTVHDRGPDPALEASGHDLVERIRGHLAEYVAQRPQAIRVDTTGIGADAS